MLVDGLAALRVVGFSVQVVWFSARVVRVWCWPCLLYTSDAADERSSVDLGGRRIIKKKKREEGVEGTLHESHALTKLLRVEY